MSNVVPQSDRPGQSVLYGNNCHEVPGPYIKKDQAREFFYWSELLLKNISTNNQPDDAIVLTLENGVPYRHMGNKWGNILYACALLLDQPGRVEMTTKTKNETTDPPDPNKINLSWAFLTPIFM